MTKYRRFQSETFAYLTEVRGGAIARTIVEEVTPGGGKSIIPVMAANQLIGAGLADFVAWFVPRVSLADQAEEDFVHKIDFNPRKYRIRQSTNDIRPWRSVQGFVSTHQALAADVNESVLLAFQSGRGILVVDECHHIYLGSPVHARLEPIFRAAKYRILLSGNLSRGDNRQVAMLPYRSDGAGGKVIDYDHPDFKFIRYGRQIALGERAKIPIGFAHANGAIRWIDKTGERQEVASLRQADDDSPALFAALRTEYAEQLLSDCVNDFCNHRAFANTRAKCLVVACDIKQARELLKYIREKWPNLRAGIAVCRDSDNNDASDAARATIRQFKAIGTHSLDILITVQMAYEGLDVPSITHLVCLTHIRSWPWIEQMLDRGTRFDGHQDAGPWETQRLRAWVPDDPRMNEAIAKIEAEQADAVREQKAAPGPRNGTGKGDPNPSDGEIVPLSGQVTETRYTGNHASSRVEVSAEESRRLVELMRQHGIGGSPLELKMLIQQFQLQSTSPEPPFVLSDEPPSVEEGKLRRRIDKFCKHVDNQYHNRDWGRANSIIRANFGIPRDEMTLEQLQQVWAFLQRRFPIRETSNAR